MTRDHTAEELAFLAWMLANGFAELRARGGKLYPVSRL